MIPHYGRRLPPRDCTPALVTLATILAAIVVLTVAVHALRGTL